MMTSFPPFNPKDLKPIRELHKKGRIPHLGLRTILQLCTDRKFPCVKIGNTWHTTEAAVQKFFWDHIYTQTKVEWNADKRAFKKIASKSRSQSDE
jgi:hypothetical protein